MLAVIADRGVATNSATEMYVCWFLNFLVPGQEPTEWMAINNGILHAFGIIVPNVHEEWVEGTRARRNKFYQDIMDHMCL